MERKIKEMDNAIKELYDSYYHGVESEISMEEMAAMLPDEENSDDSWEDVADISE